MEFTINKENFLQSLQKVQGVIEKKQTMPILSYCLLECGDNSLRISATDLEVGMRIDTDCKTSKKGSATVSARNLFDIIRELPANSSINVKLKDNNWVDITSGKSYFNLVALPAEDFPDITKTEKGSNFKIRNIVFSDMIDKTIFSVSSDETRYYLNGIYLESILDNSDKKIRMVSTDGYRLTVINRSVSKDEKFDLEKGIIIPRKGVNEIRKVLDNNEDEKYVEFTVNKNLLNLEFGDTFLSVRLINGDFPDYRRVIPAHNEKVITVSRSHFSGALKRASLVASHKSKSISMNISDNKINIQSNNPELGQADEEIEVNYKGENITIGFNAKYFLDVLEVVRSDSVDLDFNDSLSPCVIHDKEDDDYLAIIMPMRV